MYSKAFRTISKMSENEKNKLFLTYGSNSDRQFNESIAIFMGSYAKTTLSYDECPKDFLLKLNNEIAGICIIAKNKSENE